MYGDRRHRQCLPVLRKRCRSGTAAAYAAWHDSRLDVPACANASWKGSASNGLALSREGEVDSCRRLIFTNHRDGPLPPRCRAPQLPIRAGNGLRSWYWYGIDVYWGILPITND